MKLKKMIESYRKQAFFILSEGIEDVKKYFPEIEDKKFHELISLDPTFKNNDSLGKFGKWILNLYKKDKLREEDFYKVPEVLGNFIKYSSKLKSKDINAYKTLPDLFRELEPFENTEVEKSNREEKKRIKSEEIKEVFEDENFKVIIPKTENAAKIYGKNTKWCTASDENNMFSHYNRRGPLYIILDKKNKGKKYQLQFEEDEFMDEFDDRIKDFSFLKVSPELADFFGKKFEENGHFEYALILQENHSKELQKEVIEDNAWNIQYIKNPSEEIKRLAVEKNEDTIQFIEDPSEELQKMAIRRDGTTIRYIKNPSEEIKKLAVTNAGFSIYLIKNPSEELKELAVMTHPQVIVALENPSDALIQLAILEAAKVQNYDIHEGEAPLPDSKDELEKLAVLYDSRLIKFVENPSEELQYIATSGRPSDIMYIKNPSHQVLYKALSRDLDLIANLHTMPTKVKELLREELLRRIYQRYEYKPDKDNSEEDLLNKFYKEVYNTIKNLPEN